MHYYKKLYAYGLKISERSDLIEDVIQDVMIYVWGKRETFADVRHPAAYLFTFFRNSLIKKLGASEVASEIVINSEDTSSSPMQKVIEVEFESEKNSRLAASISHLSPRQKEAIYLRFFMKMSYDEAASVMGITTKALYKLMARSLEILKKKYILPLLIFQLLFVRI